MKAGEVMKVLRISRSTLHRYAKEGLIRRIKIGKRYDYLDEDVFRLLNRGLPRKTYIYVRVSTPKQKKALENQIEMLKAWAFANGYQRHLCRHSIRISMTRKSSSSFLMMLWTTR